MLTILKMHILQPKHIKLKEVDATKLLAKYNISRDQLPLIIHTDFALKDLNVAKGDIIRILRKDRDTEIEYFRIVV